MFQRLAACIFLVFLPWTYGQFQLSFGTPTPPAPLSYDPNCKDSLTNCWDFPESSCKDPYVQWARDNCPNRCGICLGPTTAPPPCVNALPNCESYDKSICTNPDYRNWASKNCRLFCGQVFCPLIYASVKAVTTTISPANCVDKVDCRLYGPNACDGRYKEWAKDNCPNHCKFCLGLPTAPPVCTDKIPNCKQYASDTCTNSMYALWVEDNCRKYCGKCSGVATIAYKVPPSPQPPGKRSAQKRQFHASHHHHYTCWDTNDPNCLAASQPPVLSSTKQPIDSSTSDFPGSEYGPNHKSPDDWDHKPQSSNTTTKKPEEKTTKSPQPGSTDIMPPTVTTMAVTKLSNSSSTKSQDSTTTTTDIPTSTDMSTETTTLPPMIRTEPSKSTQNNTESPSPTASLKTTGSPHISTSQGSPAPTQSPGPSNVSGVSGTPATPGVPQTPVVPSIVSTQPVAPSNTTPTTTTSTTTPTTNTLPTTTSEPCLDTITNCKAYGIKNCNVSVYIPYMKSHCASFCNFCNDYTKCKDNIPNCREFDDGLLCTTESYYGWASENCYLYCGFKPCAAHTTTTEATTTTTTPKPTTTHPANCTDKLPNCVYYDDDKCVGIYTAWAKEHCSKRCGYCDEPLPCVDKDQYCDKYPPHICTKPEFRGWARDNCRKFCSLCDVPTQSPGPQTTGQPNVSVTTGSQVTPDAIITSVAPSYASTGSGQQLPAIG